MAEAECAGEIIELKDSIHRKWFNLQSYPNNIKLRDKTLLSEWWADQLIVDAATALTKGKECGADPVLTDELNSLLDRISVKFENAPVIKFAGDEYYSLPPELATNIIITDINRLANVVHHIGYSFIEDTEIYGGCRVAPGENVHEINRGALTYCEGVAPGFDGSRIGYLRTGGTKVEHKLGAHKNVIQFTEQEDGYKIDLEYIESGYQNWSERQDGVVSHLEERFGFECEVPGDTARCNAKVRALNDIREMAYFISSIRDVDMLVSDCIDDAIQWAQNEAKETVEQLGHKAHERLPYPNESGQWNAEICGEPEPEPRREEEYEPTRDDVIESEESDFSYYVNKMEASRILARQASCTLAAYRYAKNALFYERTHLEPICEKIKELGGWGCGDRLDFQKRMNKRMCQEIVAGCPPDVIITAITAKSVPIWDKKLELGIVSEVCSRADDEACQKAIDAAIKEVEKGRYQLTLPLHKL